MYLYSIPETMLIIYGISIEWCVLYKCNADRWSCTCFMNGVWGTGTCSIQKIYAPSSSLLQGKHTSTLFPFPTSPQHLNISTAPPSDELDKNSQRAWLSENLSH